MKKEVILDFERETKRTYRFNENKSVDDRTIGILYVSKTAFEGEEPKKIKVTIDTMDG
jgi:hypothetical protein